MDLIHSEQDMRLLNEKDELERQKKGRKQKLIDKTRKRQIR